MDIYECRFVVNKDNEERVIHVEQYGNSAREIESFWKSYCRAHKICDCAFVDCTKKLGNDEAAKGVEENISKSKVVFVSSPLRAASPDQVEANIEFATSCCRKVYELGYVPLAPHIYLTRFMTAGVQGEDDWAMEFGKRWLDESDELWVFSQNGLSAGMKQELATAESLGKPIIYCAIENGCISFIKEPNKEK